MRKHEIYFLFVVYELEFFGRGLNNLLNPGGMLKISTILSCVSSERNKAASCNGGFLVMCGLCIGH